jgi:aryl-alcohol dehydrogenase-like predicted oxidoreductase
VTIEARTIGDTDLRLSAIGLGCNNFGVRLDLAGAREVVAAALDAGITHFDTADAYGDGESERFLGRLLAGRRDEIVIATKFGWGSGPGDGVAHGAPAAVKASVEASLDRIGTDRIDVFYYHRHDGITPLEETLGALDELVAAGTIRVAACSNLDHGTLEATGSPPRFSLLQNELSLLQTGARGNVLPWCRSHGVGFVAFRPLAQGQLTGKYIGLDEPPAGSRLHDRPHELTPERNRTVEALRDYAEARGCTLLELALGALVCEPGVASVIVGAMTAAQVEANATAARLRLTAAELDELASL